jgi:glyoxylase-like metal-dependent hydrolase (beta-lactamase superfamily II)
MASRPVTVVNVGYRSTNFWVISAGRSRLLLDLGWPGTLGTMLAQLKAKGVPVSEVAYGLATHYHPDHAGLAQELKQYGMRLLVPAEQTAFLGQIKKWMKPADRYVDIAPEGNVTFTLAESRRLLGAIGIDGEIVHTPGHSDDSVSLVLDDGSAFTGDLPPPGHATEESAALVARSWEVLRERGATRVHPGHGPIGPMPAG